MVDLPWIGDSESETENADPESEHADAAVVCAFQDGTLAVYDDRVIIERVSRSQFEDKTIPAAAIHGIDYDEGITIGYLQLELSGVEPDTGGLLSDPINENTLHFGRGDRGCARKAREILGHIG